MASGEPGSRTARAVVQQWSRSTPRAALFDFNGTLSEDEDVLFAVLAEIFAERYSWTMSERHYREHLLGMSDREIIDRVRVERGDEEPGALEAMLSERRERYLDRVRAAPTITPEARDLVRGLRAAGAHVGVVTGAQREEVREVLALCDLADAFEIVLTEEDVARGKPDPEGYLTAASLLGVAPERCLVLEDSAVGVRSAVAAGMTVVVVGSDDEPLPEGARASARRLTPDLLP